MLIADTHVHVYPVYALATALAAAHDNLKSCSPTNSFHAGLLLAERSDCHFYPDAAAGRNLPPGFRTDTTDRPEAIALSHDDGLRTFLFSGHQYVTREKIEVLGLLTQARIMDGLSAVETIAAIREAGGIPVLSWSPGKWLFKRGAIIRAIIESHDRAPLLVGDTAMRACGCPQPPLMRLAKRRGIPVVAGTDPLPFAGDESVIGTYGIISSAFDPEHPVASIRKLLLNGEFIRCGKRNRLPRAIGRWSSNQRTRTA